MPNDPVLHDDLVGPVVAYARTVARTEMPETPILSYLSPNLQNLDTDDGTSKTNRTFLYKERNYLHGRTTLDGIVLIGDAELELTDPVAKVGDIIMVEGEAISLDANAAADNLNFDTVTRSVFTVAAVEHATLTPVEVFGTSQLDHADAPEVGYIKHATEVTTYTDIFLEKVDVSGSARMMELYAEGQVDKIAAYTSEQMIVLKKQLEQRLLWSDAQAPVADSTEGRFDGAYERIAAAGNAVDMSAGNLDYDDLQAVVRTVRRKGGMPRVLFCSDVQADIINAYASSSMSADPSQIAQLIWGPHVKALRFSDLVVDIVPTADMGKYALLCSPEFVGVGPKELGRHFHPEALGKGGDYDAIQIVGEYTVRWAAPEAHAMMFDVAFA